MCIFCDIIAGKIPSYTIYEDDDVIGIFDISQVTKGHTLVIPKKHVDNFLMCDEDTLCKVMKVARSLGDHIMKQTGANGMNILSNVNEAAGQTVTHFHVHLIPRYDQNDACVIEFKDSEKQDLAALKEQLSFK